MNVNSSKGILVGRGSFLVDMEAYMRKLTVNIQKLWNHRAQMIWDLLVFPVISTLGQAYYVFTYLKINWYMFMAMISITQLPAQYTSLLDVVCFFGLFLTLLAGNMMGMYSLPIKFAEEVQRRFDHIYRHWNG